jgi:hypothetical protein
MLEIEKKYLEGRWWKYAAGVATAHLFLWVLLGYKLNPGFSLIILIKYGYVVLGIFILTAFLPFIFGRLQLKRLMWFALAGYLFGNVAYFLLALYEPTRRLALLPFASFLQFVTAGITLGVVVELGRYVYIKVFAG